MALYTGIDNVSAELGGVAINSSTSPSATEVTEWIREAGSEIERLTGRVWAETAISSTVWEYRDYDGSGKVRLKNAPIISVEKAQFTTDGLGQSSTTWTDLTEGRTNSADFVIYKDEGVLKLHNNAVGKFPVTGFESVRVAYTHGYKQIPAYIQHLCTLMVAQRFIMAVANNTAQEGGGSVSVGTISVSDPNNYVHAHLGRVNTEVDRLLEKVVPSTKFYIYESELHD